MANEIRVRRNNIAGVTTDNPLTNVATTINSPGFVDLPTIDATSHLILILDPLELAGPAEIVRVTTHTAASSTVTVVRGAEGSAARAHSVGTTWFHGPVESDTNFTQRTALSTQRPSAPFNGELIYETDTDRWTARSANGAWLPAPFNTPTARATRSTALAAANGASVLVTLPTEDFDTDNMHDLAVNPARLTFNTPGVYLVSAGATLQVVTHVPELADIRVNVSGTEIAGSTHDHERSDTGLFLSCTTLYKATAGQHVSFNLIQTNSGGASKDILSAHLSAVWLGRG